MTLTVRLARPEDAETIARIKVEGWRSAYADFMKPETLAQLNQHVDAERWQDRLANPGQQITLVGEHQGSVVGFAAAGPNQHGPEGYTSELYAIYVDPESHGKGLGSALVLACAMAMQSAGHANMAVFCFGQNTAARKYYEAKGARLYDESTYTIDGVDYPDCCYVWDSVDELVQRLTQK